MFSKMFHMATQLFHYQKKKMILNERKKEKGIVAPSSINICGYYISALFGTTLYSMVPGLFALIFPLSLII